MGGTLTNFIELYNGTSGPLGADGSSTYVGVAITSGFREEMVQRTLSFEETDEMEYPDLRPIGRINFGWFEVERGSLVVLRSGFQTVAGLAAPIPVSAVPLPASLPLLLAGAGGLMAFRRRKAAA